MLYERFKSRVREAMQLHGWRPSDLARAMGVERQMVFKYLSQGVHPGMEMQERFANALGVDPGKLTSEMTIENLSPLELTA